MDKLNSMTSQLGIINKNRAFAISDSMVTVDECKTYSGEDKIFKISDKHSCILMVSGNPRVNGCDIRDFIREYVNNTDFDEIKTIEEIRDSLNQSIVSSDMNKSINSHISENMYNFEKYIGKIIDDGFLKPSNNNMDFLDDNELLDNYLTSLIDKLFKPESEKEFLDLKKSLKGHYYDFIIDMGLNIVLIGYDDKNNNPTYINYYMICVHDDKLEFIDVYSLFDCDSTMIFPISQSEDIELNLFGFNDNTFSEIKKIIRKYLDEFNIKISDKLLEEKLNEDLYKIKLENMENIVECLNILPDSEILELMDVLIELTSVKQKFSNNVHSVGGKTTKVILKKYGGVKFI